MTPEAQRIAIAEACGWQGPHHPENVAGMAGWWSQERGVWWVNPQGERVMIGSVPDYLDDLNAMHEAEKVLTDEQKHEYEEWLSHEYYFPTMTAAAQRAEAFLRTLNLWTDDT
jgi:hypothetical protein